MTFSVIFQIFFGSKIVRISEQFKLLILFYIGGWVIIFKYYWYRVPITSAIGSIGSVCSFHFSIWDEQSFWQKYVHNERLHFSVYAADQKRKFQFDNYYCCWSAFCCLYHYYSFVKRWM